MISKDRIFKKGDVIVSGLGNIRIFTGEKFEDDSYKCLACYCVSDMPAGTDMRYARHATAKEKKLFFNALKANGMYFDKTNLRISFAENVSVETLVIAKIDWKADGPQPYKVVKKRVHPTLCQIRLLEEKVRLLDEVIKTHVKEKKELSEHLEDVKACNDKLAKELKNLKEAHRQTLICEKNLSKKLEDVQHAKDLANKDLDAANKVCNRLEEQCRKLSDSNTTLEQSNKLLEAELILQKGVVKDMRADAAKLVQSNKECKDYIDYLLGRGFFARLFNLK